MTTYRITKSKFSQLNDKRFYFPNAIISLPFAHQVLNEIDKYRKKTRAKNRKIFFKGKRTFVKT